MIAWLAFGCLAALAVVLLAEDYDKAKHYRAEIARLTAALAEHAATEPEQRVTTAAWEKIRCSHCGCYHQTACPRVRSITFTATGAPSTVEFFAEWPRDGVLVPGVDVLVEDPEPAADA